MKLLHDSDCAVHNEPAYPNGPCDCGVEMMEVADRFAHRLAMHLELFLSDYGGKYYTDALNTLGEYRSAMNRIHEKHSPTFMGEPVLPREHITTGEPCWCNPETTYKDPDTGASVIVHKEPQ